MNEFPNVWPQTEHVSGRRYCKSSFLPSRQISVCWRALYFCLNDMRGRNMNWAPSLFRCLSLSRIVRLSGFFFRRMSIARINNVLSHVNIKLCWGLSCEIGDGGEFSHVISIYKCMRKTKGNRNGKIGVFGDLLAEFVTEREHALHNSPGLPPRVSPRALPVRANPRVDREYAIGTFEVAQPPPWGFWARSGLWTRAWSLWWFRGTYWNFFRWRSPREFFPVHHVPRTS